MKKSIMIIYFPFFDNIVWSWKNGANFQGKRTKRMVESGLVNYANVKSKYNHKIVKHQRMPRSDHRKGSCRYDLFED